MAASTVCLPGDVIGTTSEFAHGAGTLVRNGSIVATLCGAQTITARSNPADRPILSVVRHGCDASALPFVGATVQCVVTRLTASAASVDILVVGERALAEPAAAVIRKEHVRETEIDKV